MEKYIIKADLHTHTIASLHAYSTIKENVEFAKQKKLEYLAITDHFFGNGDDITLKNEISRIQYLENTVLENNIRILGGCEFNLSQKVNEFQKLKNLSWKLIGLHSWFFDIKKSSLEDVYNAFKKDLVNNNFTAIAHIERELHKIDNCKHSSLDNQIKEFLENMVLLAKERNIYLELNETSIRNNEGGGIDRILYWLSFAKQNNCKICLGTDAHYYSRVGDFKNSIEILELVNYPKELILNCNEDMLKEQFKK